MVGETDSEQQRKFGKQTEEMHFNISYTLIQLLLQSFTYLLFVVSFYLLSGKLYVIFAYVEPLISPRSPECYLWLVNLQVSKLLIPREYTLPWLSEVFCLKHLGASSYPRWISGISHHLSVLFKCKQCMLHLY